MCALLLHCQVQDPDQDPEPDPDTDPDPNPDLGDDMCTAATWLNNGKKKAAWQNNGRIAMHVLQHVSSHGTLVLGGDTHTGPHTETKIEVSTGPNPGPDPGPGPNQQGGATHRCTQRGPHKSESLTWGGEHKAIQK